MAKAGWELLAIDEVVVPTALSRREDFARLQHRFLSTFEHLDEAAVSEGIASALAAHPDDADRRAPIAPQDLLVFNRG